MSPWFSTNRTGTIVSDAYPWQCLYSESDIRTASLPSNSHVIISVSPPSPEIPRTQTQTQQQQTRGRAISTPQRPRLQTDLPPRPHSRNATPTGQYHGSYFPSFSLIGALEFHDVVASLRHQAAAPSLSMFESPVTPFAGGHYHRHSPSLHRTPRTSLSSRDEDPFDQLALETVSQRGLDLTEEPAVYDDDRSNRTPTRYRDLPHNGHLDPSHSRHFNDSHSSRSTTSSILRTSATSTISDGDTDYIPLTRWQRFLSVLGHIIHTLLPSLHHFRSQSILAQIASIFAAPAVMVLTLTLPVVVTPYHLNTTAHKTLFNEDGRLVDLEEESEETVRIAEEETLEDMHEMSFNKWLTATQCAIAPVFCVAILFSSHFISLSMNSQSCSCIDGTNYHVPLLIASAVGGIASAILVAVFADKGEHPASKMARCSMGFLVAIIWIMAIADDVVQVLQVYLIVVLPIDDPNQYTH
jgi:sodium/potassium/calcium exchanger 6